MAREPLLLIAAFFTFFALAIVYVRLDFAITKDEGTEVRLKVAGYCEKVAGHQVRFIVVCFVKKLRLLFHIVSSLKNTNNKYMVFLGKKIDQLLKL